MIDMRNIDILPSGKHRIRIEHRGDVISDVAETLAEAIEVRDAIKRRIVDGELMPTRGATAKDLGPRFLGSRLGNRDADNESSRWNTHVASAVWARKPLASVTRLDGAAWLRTLRRKRLSYDPEKQGERETKFLGWQTRKHCLNLARAFFSWAIEQEAYGITSNPFIELKVAREDGDEDEGYQEGWYLDGSTDEQTRFLAKWADPKVELRASERDEKWIAAFAMASGLRAGEQWCLHLADVHVGADEKRPRVEVRFGSWDSLKNRYRAPKGRKGEKKSRTVYLHGLALEAARAWLAILPTYAPKNPLGLMFPTERGARRTRAPRSWKKVVDAFGIIPRIGRKVWWHLLRHTCASSMISGWWGHTWSLEKVCKVLGHTDVRTTQIYAHLAPSALEAEAVIAHAAYVSVAAGSRHDAVTAQRPAARSARENQGRARRDSNPRPAASKAGDNARISDEVTLHDGRVTAIRHELELIRSQQVAADEAIVDYLAEALDRALGDYDAAVRMVNGDSR
jgi:integrase